MRSNLFSKWLSARRSRTVRPARRTNLGVQRLQDRLVPATIMGYAFNDLNHNGVRDCGETGTAGATVFLSGKTTCGQSVCLTQKTDCQGNYSFDNLAPGDYIVGECPPAGVKGVTASVGELGGHAIGGIVACIHITCPTQYTCGYNFGNVPACDHNGSGGKGSAPKCNTGGSHDKGSHDRCSTGSGSKGSGGKGSQPKCSTGSNGKGSNKGSNSKSSGGKGSNNKGSHDRCDTNQSHGKGSAAKGSHAKGSAAKGSAVKC
jgi:hypothetical protein